MKKLILIFILMLLTDASATIINIPDDYATIQAGIDASSDGDTVLVSPGTYVENIVIDSTKIVLASFFLISGDTNYISQTIIDGDSAGPVITHQIGLDTISVIMGFTIQNGYSDMGGGIDSRYSGVLIDHNIIRGNSADSLGGGIYCLAGWNIIPRITNNLIENNRAEVGGGLCTYFKTTEVSNNRIINNYASVSGGGLAVKVYGEVIVYGNFISGNYSGSKGGGISFEPGSYPRLVKNNLVFNNRSADSGGGIYFYSGLVEMENSLVYGNVSNQGGGIYVANGIMRLTNMILWADTASLSDNELFCEPTGQLIVDHCGVRGGWVGEGNLAADPLFRDPLNRDFHLQDSLNCGDANYSPCIDAGNPEILDSVLDCSWGLGSQRSDIGPFAGGDSLAHAGIVINVPEDYLAIQDAINACRGRDTVRIAPGTYTELISITIKNIVIGSHYMDNEDTSFIYNTILDGNQSGPIVDIYGTDSTFVLTGLTIRNGRGWDAGGILISGGDATVKRNRIIYNSIPPESYASYGAGVACSYTSARIIHNIISNNTVESGVGFDRMGGGIASIGGRKIEITGNTITSNHAADYGGGIAIEHGDSCTMRNNYIANNNAGNGGGIYVQDNEMTIFAGNMVSNNSRDGYAGDGNLLIGNLIIENDGSGLNLASERPYVINNVIYANNSDYGGGLCCNWNSPQIINCIILENTPEDIYLDDMEYSNPSVSYSNAGAFWSGEGNLSTDPLFRDPENGDYHLMAIACGDPYDSPCIDAGDPSLIDSLLDCDWGLGTERSDMGAYGGGEGTVDIDEPAEVLPSEVALSQNYPNPFNVSTLIKYELPKQSQVTIAIYDILGRKVATLEDAVEPAGYHELIWNAEGLSSGVYFYKLQARDYIETRKMMLIK